MNSKYVHWIDKFEIVRAWVCSSGKVTHIIILIDIPTHRSYYTTFLGLKLGSVSYQYLKNGNYDVQLSLSVLTDSNIITKFKEANL